MIQKQSVSWQHIFSIVGFGLLLTIPVIINGCLNAHDFYYHLVYGKYFSEQFWQGEFYPRWLQNMNSGLGSPTFFFYAPIPYYFTSLFSPLFHYNTLSCKELGLCSSLALVASGLTAYFWLKEIVPKNSAAIASILYMAWPYHLFFDLYTRLAFAEYWSFVWIPLILYFSKKIVKDSRLNIIGLAISLALLVLTHLPTFIIFFPVSVGYAIFIASRNQWKIVSVRLSIAIIIAIGLSAIYWLPAMTTQESISMDVLTDYYYYANNFLFRGIGHSTSPDNFLSLLELSTALTGGLAFCAWKISKIYSEVTSSSRRESNFWMIVAMLSLFMMLPLSKFIWDVLPVVQKIQFPWRFNTVLTVATVGLFALAISQLKINYNFSNNLNKNFLFRIIILAALAFILTTIQILPLILPLKEKIVFWGSLKTVLSLSLIAFLLLGISFIRKPINFSNHKFLSAGFLLTLTIFLGSLSFSFKKIFFTRINFNDSSYIQASKGADEHRPRWVPKEVFNPKDLTRLSEKFPIIQIDAGKASWLIRQWQPRRIVLQINAITDTEFTIHQFYYPGWTAKLKGSSQSLPVHFSELGLLQISVPTGKHEVSLTLDAVIEERIGQIISVVSAVLTLYLVFLLRRDCNSMQNNKCMHRTD